MLLPWLVRPAHAQRAAGDPVEELRLALTIEADPTRPDELRARQQELQRIAGTIRSVGELRRALVLQEWRDEDPEQKIAQIDRAVRQELAERLAGIIRNALNSDDRDARLAAITALGDFGATVRIAGAERTFGSRFVPVMSRLVQEGDPQTREAAATALGRAAIDPNESAPVLGALLRAPDVASRRLAARALADMVEQIVQQARAATTGVRAGRAEVVAVGQAVVKAAAPGLRDSDATVRQSCLEAMRVAARMFGLGEILPVPSPAAEVGLGRTEAPPPQVVARERDDFLPLVQALAQATPAVAALLRDPVANNRVLAAHVLDDLSYARMRFLRRSGAAPGMGGAPAEDAGTVLVSQRREGGPRNRTDPAGGGPGDVLRRALVGVVPDLGQSLSDPDRRVRLAAIDTLEALEQDATPVVPDMIPALADPDRFVRWATARTLGKLGAARARGAVPGLARLLRDEDVDVRLAACLALERFGPDAAPAVPALAAAVMAVQDRDVRAAAARALQAVGPAAAPAVPALAAALSDPYARVRRAAADTLGKLGTAARPAEDALRQALNDSDEEVRRAASDALLTIMQMPQGR